MKSFKLKVITPDKILFDGEAEQITVRTTEGDVGILAGHENYVANLPSGFLKIIANGDVRYSAISSGFLKVSYNKMTTIIAESAEWAEEIDVEWANRSKEDALEKIENAKTDSDMARAELKLKRALNRINVSSMNTK